MANNEKGKSGTNPFSRGLGRLFKGKKQADDEEYLDDVQADGDSVDQDDYAAPDDAYSSGDYYDDSDSDPEGYDDAGYADNSGYPTRSRFDDPGYDDEDDGYADSGYGSEGGYDDGYADDRQYDEGYADGDRYDDDGYADDDRYDDDYDDRYDDNAGGYDDPYRDEDADEQYDEEGDYYPSQNPLVRYVDEHDWVTFVLLFLLPPLGIYLLWRRNRFDKPVRWAITAASAVWFVVALILLLRGLFGGTGDQQAQPSITIPPTVLEQTIAPEETDDGGEDIDVIDLGGAGSTDESEQVSSDTAEDSTEPEPSATPLTSTASGSATANAETVYSPASGPYYHSTLDCTRLGGAQAWAVTVDVAVNSRHQSPCPDCIGEGNTTIYYATLGGKYYHSDKTCSNMKNPQEYTEQAAKSQGKTACPVCILKTQESLEESEDKPTAIISGDTDDKSGIEVYFTANGTYYHVKSDCSGMQNATRGPLKAALLQGKSACPVCCSQAGTMVYCTSGGKSYHLDPSCQGMTGARQVTLSEALVLGKTKCDVCIKGSLAAATGAESAQTQTGSVFTSGATGDDVKVYATPNGTYYHVDSTCSGMKGAQQYTLKEMLQAGKTACPVCASSANTRVYATKGGKYYHSYATCSGMKNASSGTLAEALALGLMRCPECWNSNAGATASASAATSVASDKTSEKADSTAGKVSAARQASEARAQAAPSKATAGNTYVYATREGSYYHLNSGCGGMSGASRITLKTAINAGKKPCPICADSANRTVYSTSGGEHYHAASVCKPSGMKNGQKRTLAEALLMNQTACPYCLSSRKAAAAAVEAAGEASQAQAAAAKQAAAAQQAAAAKQATAALQTAAAKQAAAQKAAAEAATQASRAELAAKAAQAVKEAKAAQAAGTAVRQSSSTYKSGESGVRVYATVSGKYYHTKSNCSNISGTPSRVTLETALNYGKKACPVCASSATRTVYATRGGKYYHYSKSCAGSGARQGTLASALAYGMDPCPNCVTHTVSTASVSGRTTYTSGTSGINVYATQSSKYYHSLSDCSGMTGAAKISLETALNYGKKACPLCMSTAGIKVYSSSGDNYYHFVKSHAGSGAIAGTLAKARAMGLKACPNCTKLSAGAGSYENGGFADAPVSIEIYPADADSKVYVQLGTVNTYYHIGAVCKDAGFEDGTAVTLQYATDWEFKACPYCNPPTSVIKQTEDT